MSLRYIEPSQVRIWRPEGSVHLRIEIVDEQTILAAKVKRAFPLSEPARFLSLQDALGKEIAILTTVDGLDEQSRKLVEEELDRRYFTPSILSIEELTLEAGMWKWVVHTQRGETQFYVRNWRDNGFEIAPGRWLIHSVDGGRFEIRHLEALNAKSQRLMDQLL